MIVFKVDKLLADRKMKASELAEVLDCTVQTVSKLKSGRVRALRVDTLNKLCDHFHCQPGDIVEFVNEDEAMERYGEDFVNAQREYFEL